MTASLTSAERLERALRGGDLDRVPIWMLFNPIPQNNPWYADFYNEPAYATVFKRVLEETDLFQRHWFSPGVFYSGSKEVPKMTQVWREQGTRLFETTIESPVGTLNAYLRRTPNGVESKNLIESLDDLDRILSLPYEPFEPDLSEFRAHREQLGDRGLMMVNFCDPMSLLYFHCDTENWLLWAATDMDRIVGFLDVLHERAYAHLRYLLENDMGPVYFIVGSEFAEPPVVSPAMFRRLVVNYDKRLIQLMHEYDALAIVHHHGPALAILDDFLHMGADGIHPPEAPPVGDTPLEVAKARIGQQICLIGNIQFDSLARDRPENIDAAVRELVSCWAPGGRFVLSLTAGPYPKKLNPCAIANYLQFIESGVKYGHYAREV